MWNVASRERANRAHEGLFAIVEVAKPNPPSDFLPTSNGPDAIERSAEFQSK
jgi:hypothetical protein